MSSAAAARVLERLAARSARPRPWAMSQVPKTSSASGTGRPCTLPTNASTSPTLAERVAARLSRSRPWTQSQVQAPSASGTGRLCNLATNAPTPPTFAERLAARLSGPRSRAQSQAQTTSASGTGRLCNLATNNPTSPTVDERRTAGTKRVRWAQPQVQPSPASGTGRLCNLATTTSTNPTSSIRNRPALRTRLQEQPKAPKSILKKGPAKEAVMLRLSRHKERKLEEEKRKLEMCTRPTAPTLSVEPAAPRPQYLVRRLRPARTVSQQPIPSTTPVGKPPRSSTPTISTPSAAPASPQTPPTPTADKFNVRFSPIPFRILSSDQRREIEAFVKISPPCELVGFEDIPPPAKPLKGILRNGKGGPRKWQKLRFAHTALYEEHPKWIGTKQVSLYDQ